MYKKYTFLVFLVFILACSSSQPVSDAANSNNENAEETINDQSPPQPSSTDESYLDQYRSALSDTYSNRSNDIPQEYIRIKIEDESDEETDLFEGYRVQIYSGQNVALADTIASIFRIWSDKTIVGYQADTYTFFKAPYYRVHVGDFHKRDLAIYFSNLLKRRFRDAWVVYDRIDPYKIPSDTTDIYSN
ncbi:MAG: hypothetical protein BalsKO_14490 [Balneolaceae bacterium]